MLKKAGKERDDKQDVAKDGDDDACLRQALPSLLAEVLLDLRKPDNRKDESQGRANRAATRNKPRTLNTNPATAMGLFLPVAAAVRWPGPAAGGGVEDILDSSAANSEKVESGFQGPSSNRASVWPLARP